MRLQPVVVEGVTHPVTVTRNRFGGDVRLFVDGRPVPQTHSWPQEFFLPLTDGGTVTARVRTGMGDPYPSVVVGGTTYRTGPRLPAVLRALALVPLLVALSGLGGVIVAVPAFLSNQALLRTPVSAAVRTVGIVGVDVAAIGLTILAYRLIT